MSRIEAPTNCPVCGSALERANMQLFCRSSKCPAKFGKAIEHFAKKLNIKGLAEKTIEKLGIDSFYEIYSLTLEDITNKLSSKALGSKLFAEIENSKECELSAFISALGIPLIGDTAAKKLANVVDSIEQIDEKTAGLAGLGPIATHNLLNWLAANRSLLRAMPIKFKPKNAASSAVKITVCITGALQGYKNRSEAVNFLSGLGVQVKDSVTRDVTVLVCEDPKKIGSSSYKKAEQLGLPIVTLTDLLKIIEDNT